MNFLRFRLARNHLRFIAGILILLISLAGRLDEGAGRVWASEVPVARLQTIPPLPTPRPTAVPATPTPRPRDDDDNNQGQPPAPTATATVAPAQPTAAPDATTSALTGVINATTLNVRQGPGATFPVLGRLTNGATVTVVARNADNTWLNICCLPDAQTPGWVSAQFVTPNYTAAELAALPVGDGATLVAGVTPATTPAAPAGGVPGTVAAVSLNVRAAPAMTATILGKLGSGATVTLLGRAADSDWWLVCCVPGDGGNGWVSAQYIATAADAAALAALPVTTGRETPGVATSTPAPTASATEAASVELANTTLVLTVAQEPAYPVQGEQLVFAFTLTNTGAVDAVNTELSFEVPAGLSFVGVSASDGGEAVEFPTDAGASLLIVTWPALAADTVTVVKIMAAIGDDLAAGVVVDGAAVALADNAVATSAPVSVGMPPAAPPDFQ